ncbi:MAG: ABC transporter ATP-binding protein [Thermoplasmatota archaeon]
MPVVEVRSVSKSFGRLKAVDNISFDVMEGEFFGLLGQNGAGKTTLLRMLTGQLQQDSGSISVLGRSNRDPVKVKMGTGIVPEAESPPSFLTAKEFLELVCRIRGVKDIQRRIDSWLDLFLLRDKEDVLCKDLSKGQRQKIMLSSAMIHDPRLLFLDEPFINLDPIFQKKVREHLMELKEGGTTILMCTHILDMAERTCDRVAVINRGRILSIGGLKKMRGRESLEEIFVRLVEGDEPG